MNTKFSRPDNHGTPSMDASWPAADEPEVKPKGMQEDQKQRMAGYMDAFRKKNCGCLLCIDPNKAVQPIAEYSAYPEVDAVNARLFLYGLCRDHARKAGSDRDAEMLLSQLAEATKDEVSEEEAQAVVIDLSTPIETRKFL